MTEIDKQNFAQNGGQILSFVCEGRFFAFDVLAVADIIEIPEITIIPKTPDYILGVINHRGKAVPVMDFRIRLKLPKGYYNDKSCIIILEVNSHQFGVLVDGVSDVEKCTPEQIALSPVGSSTICCFITTAKKRISMLDPEKLIKG